MLSYWNRIIAQESRRYITLPPLSGLLYTCSGYVKPYLKKTSTFVCEIINFKADKITITESSYILHPSRRAILKRQKKKKGQNKSKQRL